MLWNSVAKALLKHLHKLMDSDVDLVESGLDQSLNLNTDCFIYLLT